MIFRDYTQIEEHMPPQENTMIASPISGTEIRAEEKWKSKLYLREYQRQRRRELGLMKTRPRLAEDGVTLYRDKYPHLVKQRYYEPRPRVYCETCHREMAEGYASRHFQSRAHLHQLQLQQSPNMDNEGMDTQNTYP